MPRLNLESEGLGGKFSDWKHLIPTVAVQNRLHDRPRDVTTALWN